MGKRDRGKWASAPQALRKRQKRTFTLSEAVHAKLDDDAFNGKNISAITDAALRWWYEMPGEHEPSEGACDSTG